MQNLGSLKAQQALGGADDDPGRAAPAGREELRENGGDKGRG